MANIAAFTFAQQAATGGYVGIPYSRLDCQAFVQRVLSDCGYKHNWRGSNHIWREAVKDREQLPTDRETIPAGVLLFTIKNDGGERQRGYNDNMGNAAHVGIYLGGGKVIHSTTGGVQWDNVSSKRWTHYAKLLCIDYQTGAAVIYPCGRSCSDCWRNK